MVTEATATSDATLTGSVGKLFFSTVRFSGAATFFGVQQFEAAFTMLQAGEGFSRQIERFETTDVLSFAFDHEGEYYGEDEPSSEFSRDIEFVMPPGEVEGLGEVIISYPQAQRQAQAAGHSVVRELAHLLAHGILHLLGYDHLESKDEAVMQAKETDVLAQVLNEDE